MPASYPTRPTHPTHQEAPPGQDKPHDELKHLSGDEHAHKAIILVGGIKDNYTYFDSWKDSLAAKDTAVLGFNHDHRSETMKEGAHNLAEAIKELKSQGFDEVTVVAHSMGGLVSKGALNELVRTGASEDFKHVELHTFGTPWGGFVVGDLARFTPGAETISKAIGYPMGPEIGPHSDYMKSLAQDWPKNMEFNVYSGTTDNIANPNASSTHERYAEIAGKADNFVLLEGFKHTEYKEADPSVMQAARGLPVKGMDEVVHGQDHQQESSAQKVAAREQVPSVHTAEREM